MTSMKKLVVNFRNAMGKSQTISFKDVDTTKTPSQIKTLLTDFIGLNLFQKDGVRSYETLVSAKFVETIETPIFDVEAETLAAYKRR
ncbi:DUF2922 domain-containing protein [Enterococcus sp. 669A]|uniref:DUF2922 domain-containing protein n=2 Tax=Candidatus Enterococcus moelleringii TaxID=2815325 RepID=A0ABS3LAF0_9ENTE|nr:DUF2922 domain-containing protein [Enterococcus sp. 669A]